jgi:hypothetical protein
MLQKYFFRAISVDHELRWEREMLQKARSSANADRALDTPKLFCGYALSVWLAKTSTYHGIVSFQSTAKVLQLRG